MGTSTLALGVMVASCCGCCRSLFRECLAAGAFSSWMTCETENRNQRDSVTALIDAVNRNDARQPQMPERVSQLVSC